AEAGRGRRYRPQDYRQAVGEGFIGICAETGETIRATDLERDSRRLIAFEEEYQVRTELAVPVRRGEEVLGVIHLLSDRENDFPDSDIAGIEHVAPHIGVALQNARMMDQRTRDRHELERAHRQLANIVRSTAVGITSTDTRGVYTHWTPSCEAMLGYTASEVIDQKTAADFAAEPYDLQEALRECKAAGRVVTERAWLRKDGTPRTIRETRVPLEDGEGVHVGFTSYLVDVTEQKQAQEQLRRERDMLQVVVDAMGAGLALFDADLKLQWANNTLTEWFGLDEEDLGKTCHDVYLCGRSPEEKCPALRAALDGRAITRLHEFTDRAGQWHCYQQIFTPADMAETRLVVLSLDVTEQRRQNEQLRLISKLTEKVDTTLNLERVLHLVLTCVTAGHAIGCNRAAVFLLDEDGEYLQGEMAVGPTSAEEASRIWHELDEAHPTIDELLEPTSPSDSDRELTERVRSIRIPLADEESTLVSTLLGRSTAYVGDARADARLSGQLAEALGLQEFVCVPLAAQDEPLGVMLADNKYSGKTIDRYQVELLEMFCRQASLAIANARAYERIRMQLQEIQRTRDRLIAAERMASVGRMAGHLAHEIRNPLTTIGGFAASIARRHPEDSLTHRNATIIHDEVRRLERTLVNVLDYTRPLRPNKEPTHINELVRETLSQFDQQMEDAGIKLRTSLAEDLPAIMADPQMIKQVVLNLIKNAMEAMEDREQATLSVITSVQDGMAVIEVADTGGGMPPEAQESLFSPFFTTKIGGVGLGLSVSQRIVRQHGGDISVQSELGVGSRFVVSLAAEQPEQEGV
ncbi:MAG: GAF domain-containing protein, partial [Candidatus Brocadiia bacterium]